MPEFSAHELSELRMKREEQEAVDRSRWPQDIGRELVFEPDAVREALKQNRRFKTIPVKPICQKDG